MSLIITTNKGTERTNIVRTDSPEANHKCGSSLNSDENELQEFVALQSKETNSSRAVKEVDIPLINDTDVCQDIAENTKNVDLEEVDDPLSGAPIDRGWAWVILAGCVFEISIYGGLLKSFGVFFLQYQKRFNSTAAETAIMSMIQNISISIAGLFVMTVGLQKFSNRTAVCIGGALTFIGYITTAFIDDIRLFYIAQGVFAGVGMAMIHPPMFATIGVYFKKHRGLANSLFTGGGSIGGFIFGPIVVKLFEVYNYTGAMLIVSGLLLNIFVAGLLLRPIESYTKITKTKYDNKNVLNNNDNKEKCNLTVINHTNGSVNSVSMQSSDGSINGTNVSMNQNVQNIRKNEFKRLQSYDPTSADVQGQSSPMLQRIRAHSLGNSRRRTISDSTVESRNHRNNSRPLLYKVVDAIDKSQSMLYSSGVVFGSMVDIAYVPQNSTNNKKDTDISSELHDTPDSVKEDVISSGTCGLSIKSCLMSTLSTVFDLKLLRIPVFIVFMLMAFVFLSGIALSPVIMPPYGRDIGATNEQLGLIVSISAGVDLVAKILIGVVADRKWIKRSTILIVIAVISGTLCNVMRFITTFPLLLAAAVVAGTCAGQYGSMFAVVLIELIGADLFKKSLGFTTLVHGMSIAIVFPIVGLLRDTTGAYIASFHLLGVLCYLGGIFIFIISIMQKRNATM